jgi:hypothetical protein
VGFRRDRPSGLGVVQVSIVDTHRSSTGVRFNQMMVGAMDVDQGHVVETTKGATDIADGSVLLRATAPGAVKRIDAGCLGFHFCRL